MNFDEEFDELAALAYRTAFRILGSRGDAEDVAQEVMTRAMVRWRRVESHARPWVCRVAANESIGILRRQRRRDQAPMEVPVVADTGEWGVHRADLQNALLLLPRRQREVLALRYIADLSEQSVADELGVSVGTVKTHAHRALTALRATLGEPEEEMNDVRAPG